MQGKVPAIALGAVVALSLSGVPQHAWALTAGAESVEAYSSCGSGMGNLNYANDQSIGFINAMVANGQTKKFLYINGQAWATDFREDQMGGTDYPYGDTAQVLLESGHGGVFGSPTRYVGYLCPHGGGGSAYATTNVALGEQPSQPYSAHSGSVRFLILCTCFSVQVGWAPQIWLPVFARGKNLMYVMGYTGTSVDSETTDEVPEDFVDKAVGSAWSVKQAWFWAIEDWDADDTGSLITRGSTPSEAISNRDNIVVTIEPPVASSWPPGYYAMAWHEG